MLTLQGAAGVSPAGFSVTHRLILPARYLFSAPIVAQSCTLLYRRVALCQVLGNGSARDRSDALPNTIRRYGRLKICATAWPRQHAKQIPGKMPAARWPVASIPLRPRLFRYDVQSEFFGA